MPLHQLTERAQTTFHNMKDEVEEAHNAVLAIQRRIHEVENQIRNLNRDTQADELARHDNELARQQLRLAGVQVGHQQLARVLTALRTWVDMLPRNAVFEDARPCHPDIRTNEDHLDAVNRIRLEIQDVQTYRVHALRNVLPIEDIYEKIDAYVFNLAEQGKPKVWMDSDKLVVKLTPNVTTATLAWFAPDEMRDRLYSMADKQRERELRDGCEVQSHEAKADAVALYDKSILSLERQEETLIREAAMMGTTIPRREQASPLAILGLKTKINKPKMTKTLAEGSHPHAA